MEVSIPNGKVFFLFSLLFSRLSILLTFIKKGEEEEEEEEGEEEEEEKSMYLRIYIHIRV